MKYKVTIPEPSAKRLTPKCVLIETTDGWGGCRTGRIDWLGEAQIIFQMDDDIPPAKEVRGIMDAIQFRVYVEFANANGSRTEMVEVIPEVWSKS